MALRVKREFCSEPPVMLTVFAVYGGVIDVLLAMIPWFVIRGLLLERREKFGLSLAMSLGFITGIVVIFRAFHQLRKIDNNYRTSASMVYAMTLPHEVSLTLVNRLPHFHVHLPIPRTVRHPCRAIHPNVPRPLRQSQEYSGYPHQLSGRHYPLSLDAFTTLLPR